MIMIIILGDQKAKGVSDSPCWTVIMNPTFSEKVVFSSLFFLSISFFMFLFFSFSYKLF